MKMTQFAHLTFSEHESSANSLPALYASISDNREWEGMAKPDILRECTCIDEAFLEDHIHTITGKYSFTNTLLWSFMNIHLTLQGKSIEMAH